MHNRNPNKVHLEMLLSKNFEKRQQIEGPLHRALSVEYRCTDRD